VNTKSTVTSAKLVPTDAKFTLKSSPAETVVVFGVPPVTPSVADDKVTLEE
jgi:hypothetical protein